MKNLFDHQHYAVKLFRDSNKVSHPPLPTPLSSWGDRSGNGILCSTKFGKLRGLSTNICSGITQRLKFRRSRYREHGVVVER